MTLADRIDALLPQTQCTRCGYDGCRPYAESLAANATDIDRCPPGGNEGIVRLAALLGRPVKGLSPEVGAAQAPQVAVIDEATCIGCTKCIQACPVDAIVGASKRMHTIIAAHCTGCELCLPPCPVDCIALVPVGAFPPADDSRARHQRRNVRLERDAREREEQLAALE